MKKGQIITTSNITAKRPGNGTTKKNIINKINKSLKTNHLLRDKDLT